MTCSCSAAPNAAILCGTCALLGQTHDRIKAGTSTQEELFDDLQGSQGSQTFRMVASALCLEPKWHAFRRGMASDMLSQGRPISIVLACGGWKPTAFLKYVTSADLDSVAAVEQAFAGSDGEGD